MASPHFSDFGIELSEVGSGYVSREPTVASAVSSAMQSGVWVDLSGRT